VKVSYRERVRSVNRRVRDGASAGRSQPVVRSWSLDRHRIVCFCLDHIREYRPLVPTRSGGRVARRCCSLSQFHGLSPQHSPRRLPDGRVLCLFSGSRPPKDSFVIAPLPPRQVLLSLRITPDHAWIAYRNRVTGAVRRGDLRNRTLNNRKEYPCPLQPKPATSQPAD
jgi:hypothetical protein